MSFDIKLYIASFDTEAWYKLYRIDDEFKKYACSTVGINRYINLFTEIIYKNNAYNYYIFCKLQRPDDLPAIIRDDGAMMWYKNNKLHRINNPAVIYESGRQEWYYDGVLHREGDYPAIIVPNDIMMYYKYGVIHRDENPAVIKIGFHDEFWINGRRNILMEFFHEVGIKKILMIVMFFGIFIILLVIVY
jgi:hypothetical protein